MFESKNVKCLKAQNEYGKLPIAEKPNDEISIDFAGPFLNAKKNKMYLFVSIDHISGWSEVLFLLNPTADKVVEFLNEYIAKHGFPKRVRTDPGTVFKSEKKIISVK